MVRVTVPLRLSDRQETENLHQWHLKRLREVRPQTDTSRPHTLQYKHLQENARAKTSQRGELRRVKVTNSLLADRMVAIMTGESSHASEYRQGNYPEITEKQQLFRSHARRRRRKEMHRIISENEKIGDRLGKASSAYTQESLRPRLPVQLTGATHFPHGALPGNSRPTTVAQKGESPCPPAHRPSTKPHHHLRRASHPSHKPSTYDAPSNTTRGGRTEPQKNEEGECCGSISPRLLRRKLAAPGINKKGVVARKILKLDTRLVVAVVQREGGGGGVDTHSLTLVDMDDVDRTCAFALPDAEIRMWTARWRPDVLQHRWQHEQDGLDEGLGPSRGLKKTCLLTLASTWLRLLKCLVAWVPATGGTDTLDKAVFRPANDDEEQERTLGAGSNQEERVALGQQHAKSPADQYVLERIVCFASTLAYNVSCRVDMLHGAVSRVAHVRFDFKALTVGGKFPSAADTRVDCDEDAIKSFAEYMDVPYEAQRKDKLMEDLMDELVNDLYLWDRGDGRLVCAGPIYYFTAATS